MKSRLESKLYNKGGFLGIKPVVPMLAYLALLSNAYADSTQATAANSPSNSSAVQVFNTLPDGRRCVAVTNSVCETVPQPQRPQATTTSRRREDGYNVNLSSFRQEAGRDVTAPVQIVKGIAGFQADAYGRAVVSKGGVYVISLDHPNEYIVGVSVKDGTNQCNLRNLSRCPNFTVDRRISNSRTARLEALLLKANAPLTFNVTLGNRFGTVETDVLNLSLEAEAAVATPTPIAVPATVTLIAVPPPATPTPIAVPEESWNLGDYMGAAVMLSPGYLQSVRDVSSSKVEFNGFEIGPSVALEFKLSENVGLFLPAKYKYGSFNSVSSNSDSMEGDFVEQHEGGVGLMLGLRASPATETPITVPSRITGAKLLVGASYLRQVANMQYMGIKFAQVADGVELNGLFALPRLIYPSYEASFGLHGGVVAQLVNVNQSGPAGELSRGSKQNWQFNPGVDMSLYERLRANLDFVGTSQYNLEDDAGNVFGSHFNLAGTYQLDNNWYAGLEGSFPTGMTDNDQYGGGLRFGNPYFDARLALENHRMLMPTGNGDQRENNDIFGGAYLTLSTDRYSSLLRDAVESTIKRFRGQ